jgi:hypothetical protein
MRRLHLFRGVSALVISPPPPPPPPPPPGTPLLQNVSINMGANTPPGMGTVLLKNLGLVASGSAAIVSWRTSNVVATGGGANTDLGGLLATNTATATARSPKTTLGSATALTTVTLPATSYAVTVTGVTAGGLEATCILTIVPQASAFNLGDDNASFGRPDNMDSLSQPGNLKTNTGGLTMLISTGADYTASPFAIDGFLPSSGRTAVRYADPARPSRVPGLQASGTNNFDFDGFGIGGGINHKIFLHGACDSVTVKNCYPLGDSIADVAINAGGTAGNQDFILLSGVTNCTADNNYLRWGGRGLVLGGGSSGNFITNNVIRYVFGDLSAVGQSTNDTVSGNLCLSPMRDTDPSGSPDHIDNMQWDTAVAGTSNTATNLVWAGNIFAQADGTAAASGFQGGVNTYVGVTFKNNISLFRASTAANLSGWQDSTLRDSTWLLVGSGKVGMQALNADDNVVNTTLNFVSGGGAGANALTRVFIPYGRTMDATWTITNSPAHTFNIPNSVQFSYDGVNFNHEPDMGGSTYATSGVFKYANTLERLNNYHPVNNPAGADYPNMTPAQIKALIIDVLTPATSGSLDLGGANANTIGAVARDGTLKVA